MELALCYLCYKIPTCVMTKLRAAGSELLYMYIYI